MYYVSRKASSSGSSLSVRNSLLIRSLMNPLQKQLFFFPKPLLNWLLGFQIILVLFENIQSGCNSNLVFRHIKPQDNLKEPSSLYGLEMLFTQHCFTLSERLRSQLEVLSTWLL